VQLADRRDRRGAFATLPQVTARHDRQRRAGEIQLGQVQVRLHRQPAHRAHRRPGETHRRHLPVAGPAHLAQRQRRLPVRKAVEHP
jgi:hypothetical protein